MNESKLKQHESILLRILWMVLFVLVWQVAEVVLAVAVLVQLVYRLFNGAPSLSVMSFGDSLSQYLAQIGRFGTFHTDQKPWPFADWPTPRAPEGEAPHVVTVKPQPAPSAPQPAAATPPPAPVTPQPVPAATPPVSDTPQPGSETPPVVPYASPAAADTSPSAPVTPPSTPGEGPKL
ncbi:MAG: DUF4389 domain-containing protein [Pseudomonas sp.]|nr:MAG: DUF4389 domain-containing protein [Pseudomonas sp.]